MYDYDYVTKVLYMHVQCVCLTLGPLTSVTDVKRHLTNVSWIPPFSQNLTDFEPDIIYCLAVYRVTCSTTEPLFHVCGIEVSYYINNTLSSSDLYKFEVTPMSNGGSLNGITSTVQGKHCWSIEY